MIPLVGFAKELELQVALVRQIAAEVSKQHNTRLNYLVGTMIEIPRACVVADEIAKEAESSASARTISPKRRSA